MVAESISAGHEVVDNISASDIDRPIVRRHKTFIDAEPSNIGGEPRHKVARWLDGLEPLAIPNNETEIAQACQYPGQCSGPINAGPS